MVKQKKQAGSLEKDSKQSDEESRQEDRLKKLMVQQTTAVENEQDDSAIAMDKLASLAESVINSSTRPSRSRNLPLIGNKEVRSLAITNEEFIRDLNSGQSGLSGTSTEQNRATHQITTRSVTGRLAKKPKKDISPPHSPLRKLAKDSKNAAETTPELVRMRRPWESWTAEDKNLFFEALCEHGKDFDAILTLMTMKHKKRGADAETTLKTKDQIRHFYYRTWHKLSTYVGNSPHDDVSKQVLELYGLICYGELRKKSCGKIDEKMGMKLRELVHLGHTNVKYRGKNIRLRTPCCRALKKLNNIEESREEAKMKLPEHIPIELTPRTNAAWSRVQALSQNPRLLLQVKPDRTLTSVIDFLTKKWRSESSVLRENLGEKVEETQELILSLAPNTSLTPIEIRPAPSQPKSSFSFGNFIKNVKSSSNLIANNSSPPSKTSLKASSSKSVDESSSQTKLTPDSNTPVPVIKPAPANDTATTNSLTNDFFDKFSSETNKSLPANSPNDNNLENKDGNEAELVKSEDCLTTASTTASVDADMPADKTDETTASTSALDNVGSVAPQNEAPPPAKPAETPSLLTPEDKVIKLSGLIDRIVGQEVTLAELYLMMGRPKNVAIEYNWVDKSQPAVGTADSTKPISSKLRRLVDVAITEFANFQSNQAMRAMSPPLSSNVRVNSDGSASKVVSRSPRVVQSRSSATGVRGRKDSLVNISASEAGLDQSANSPWSIPTSSFAGPSRSPSSSISNMPNSLALTSIASTVNESRGEPRMPPSETVFRVPTSLPPRSQVLVKNVNERTIVDKSLLQQMPIFQKQTDLFLPRKTRSRNTRKPLAAQRTLLPKVNQIVTLSLMPGLSNSMSGFLPTDGDRAPFLSQLASMSSQNQSTSTEARPTTVITMEPSELKSATVRRIVPITLPPNDSDDMPTLFSSNQPSSRPPLSDSSLASSVAASYQSSSKPNANSAPNLPMAITGIDAFLATNELSQDSSSMDPKSKSLAHLCDNTFSMPSLDISMGGDSLAGDSSDRFLDLALANSNSSFTGFMESTAHMARDKNDLSLNSGNNSFLDSTKNFKCLASDEPWLTSEDFNLSSFLNGSPMKKDYPRASVVPTGSVPTSSSQTSAQVMNQPFICEGSRDSVILGKLDVDSTLQCMMNESSLDYASKFADLAASMVHESTALKNAARSDGLPPGI